MALNTANQMLLIPDGSSYIFDANRNRYSLFVTLTDPFYGMIVIPMTSTESVEWSNEVNRLCLTGQLIVNDANGQIGNVVGSQNLRCDIVFSRLEPSEPILKTRDPKFGPVLERVETQNPVETFQHSFLVTNIEVMGKIEQTIKYKVHLVSINYLGCVRRIEYTNYAKSSPVDIFDIAKELMTPAFANILNPEVFELDTGGLKSDVKLYWCTNPGDTIMTAIPRLFTKLFFSEKIQLNGGGTNEEITTQCAKVLNPAGFSIPYIVTLPKIEKIVDKPGYKLINFCDKFATDRSASGGTIIFLDGTGFEALARKNAQRLGSVTSEQLTRILNVFRPYTYKLFDHQTGLTETMFNRVDDIVGLWQDKAELSEVDKEKFDAKSIIETFGLGAYSGDNLKVGHDLNYGSCNTNGLHVYSDLVSLFLYGDTIVFEKDGNLADLPGNNIVLGDETSVSMMSEASESADWDSKLKANNQFIGEYNIVKTHHVINPNAKTFTETLLLARKKKHAWSR